MNSEVSLVLDEELSQFPLTCWLILKGLGFPCAQGCGLVECDSYGFAFAAQTAVLLFQWPDVTHPLHSLVPPNEGPLTTRAHKSYMDFFFFLAVTILELWKLFELECK